TPVRPLTNVVGPGAVIGIPTVHPWNCAAIFIVQVTGVANPPELRTRVGRNNAACAANAKVAVAVPAPVTLFAVVATPADNATGGRVTLIAPMSAGGAVFQSPSSKSGAPALRPGMFVMSAGRSDRKIRRLALFAR